MVRRGNAAGPRLLKALSIMKDLSKCSLLANHADLLVREATPVKGQKGSSAAVAMMFALGPINLKQQAY